MFTKQIFLLHTLLFRLSLIGGKNTNSQSQMEIIQGHCELCGRLPSIFQAVEFWIEIRYVFLFTMFYVRLFLCIHVLDNLSCVESAYASNDNHRSMII